MKTGKKLLIIINGEAGSGKDTFIDFCREYKRKYIPELPIHNYHRSDYAKRMLQRMGWNGNKTPEVRKLLADMVDFGETTGFNTTNLYASVINSEGLIFYHIRDPKTIEKVVNHYKGTSTPVLTIFIRRDVDKVEADRWGKEDYKYDFVISNDKSLDAFEEEAMKFMRSLERFWR